MRDPKSTDKESKSTSAAKRQHHDFDKIIRLAIFWLPIVGALCLGIAATIWWGNGSKTVALWACGFTGALMFLTAFALQLNAPKTWIVVAILLIALAYQISRHLGEYEPPAFRIEWVTTLITKNDQPRMLWHETNTKTIHPVKQAIYLTITNLQQINSTVQTYRLEGASSRWCPWTAIPLVPVDADIWSQYSPDRAKSINTAVCGLNAQLMGHSFTPGTAVSGWIWIKDFPVSPKFIRIVLDTNKVGPVVTSIARPHVERTDVSFLLAPLAILGDVSLAGLQYAN